MNLREVELRDLEEKLRIARRALLTAARTFRLYSDHHRAKGKPEAERKAQENASLAQEMEKALTDTEKPVTKISGRFDDNSGGPVFIQNNL